MKTKLKIEFGKPHNGWLPVKIVLNDIEEYFVASNIPFNPITQLEDALDSAITGGGGEVWWHLEPAGYYLNVWEENQEYKLIFEYSIDSTKITREIIFEVRGSFKDIIVPIWRSLRNLQTKKYSSFGVSDKTIESITKNVKAKK